MPRLLDWGVKDPDEKGDYTVDWSSWLGTDTISTSAFSYAGSPDTTPLVLTGSTSTDTTTTVTIDDGTIGTLYSILNRITTGAGWTWDQTTLLRIRQK